LAAGALPALAALAWWQWQPPQTAPPRAPDAASAAADVIADPSATLVLPLAIDAGDDIAWARLGLMDYVAERMRAAGLSVPPSESTLALLGGIEGDSGRDRLQRSVPGAMVVGGEVERVGEGW